MELNINHKKIISKIETIYLGKNQPDAKKENI